MRSAATNSSRLVLVPRTSSNDARYASASATDSLTASGFPVSTKETIHWMQSSRATMRDGREVPSVSQGTDRAQFTSGVVKLDRLGRSTRDVLNIVHEIEEKGASLRVLEPAIDTGGPMGRMILTVLGMVAEMEHGSIFDRQRAGIEAAKARGIYKRRPVTFDHAKIVALRKEGLGATEIARAVGCLSGFFTEDQSSSADAVLLQSFPVDINTVTRPFGRNRAAVDDAQLFRDIAIKRKAVHFQIASIRRRGEQLDCDVVGAVRRQWKIVRFRQSADFAENRDAAATGDVRLGIGHAARRDICLNS